MGNTSPLRRAMLNDDVEGVKAVLAEHGEGAPDIINEDYTSDCLFSCTRNVQSPIHTAISRDKTGIAHILMQNGADVNAPGLYGQNCLHVAGKRNNVALCKLALGYGAELYGEDNQGKRPIHAAAMSFVGRNTGRIDALEFLLAEVGKPEDVSLVDEKDNTPLHCAAWFGNCKAVEYLLERGADPNATNKYGRTPLDESTLSGKQVASDILVKWKRK